MLVGNLALVPEIITHGICSRGSKGASMHDDVNSNRECRTAVSHRISRKVCCECAATRMASVFRGEVCEDQPHYTLPSPARRHVCIPKHVWVRRILRRVPSICESINCVESTTASPLENIGAREWIRNSRSNLPDRECSKSPVGPVSSALVEEPQACRSLRVASTNISCSKSASLARAIPSTTPTLCRILRLLVLAEHLLNVRDILLLRIIRLEVLLLLPYAVLCLALSCDRQQSTLASQKPGA